MKTRKAQLTIHIRTKNLGTEPMVSQEDTKHRLTDFFALLLEIDQQNYVAKECLDAQQAE
jgi:hypothetical protein